MPLVRKLDRSSDGSLGAWNTLDQASGMDDVVRHTIAPLESKTCSDTRPCKDDGNSCVTTNWYGKGKTVIREFVTKEHCSGQNQRSGDQNRQVEKSETTLKPTHTHTN